MILFMAFNLILFIALKNDKTISKTAFLFVYLIPLFLLNLWLIEYSLGGIDFFISDENVYTSAGKVELPAFSERYLWYFINYWVLNYDLSLGGLALKLINIPLFVGLIFSLKKIFASNKVAWIPIILPYTAFTAIFNFRDIPILCLSALAVYCYFKEPKEPIICILSLIALYLLRPFTAMAMVILLTMNEFIQFFKRLKNGKLRFGVLLLIIPLGLLWNTVQDKVLNYYQYLIYTTFGAEAVSRAAVASNGLASGNIFVDFPISLMRYIFTPFPTSVLARLLEGGSEMWGFVDDIVLLVNQLGFYIILIYLVFNVKWVVKTIKRLPRMIFYLFASYLIYWPIYSFHLYGVTHLRQKIMFQIVLFLIALLTSKHKKEYQMQLIHVGDDGDLPASFGIAGR